MTPQPELRASPISETGKSACAAFALVIATAVAVLLINVRILNDDVHITLEYAKHLAQLQGFVFHPGEQVFGLTNPLVGLLIGTLSLITRLPILASTWIVNVAALLLAAGSARRMLPDQLWALAFVPLLFLSPQTTIYFGNEFPLVAALGLTAIAATRESRWFLAGLATGLLYLARFDTALLAPILVLPLLLRIPDNARNLARFLLGFAPILVTWHLFAWFYYGQVLPLSLTSSIHTGATYVSFWNRLLHGELREAFVTGSGLAAFFLIVGLVTCARHCWELLVWAALHAAFLSIGGFPGVKPWYFMLVALALLTLTAGGAAFVARRLSLRGWQAVAFVALLGFVLRLSTLRSEYEEDRFHLYRLVADWFNANARPTESLGLHEIGVIGFYTDHAVVDFHGLVTPFQTELGPAPERARIVERYRPQWLALWAKEGQDVAAQFPDLPQYEPVAVTNSAHHLLSVAIFKRRE